MPIVNVNDLGLLGVNTQLPPHELPPNVLTYAKNVRATIGGLESVNNYSLQTNYRTGAYSFSLLQYTTNPGARYWITGNKAGVWAHNGTTMVQIQTGATALAESGWDFLNFNGVLIANSGTSVPKYWNGVSFTSNVMAILPGWLNLNTCKVMRVFKNFVIAMNVTELPGSVTKANRVWWSNTADPGTIPDTWNLMDDTKDAGDVYLADTGGEIHDGLGLADLFLIYKSDCVWSMTFTGSAQIFRFQKVTNDFGILGKNCVANFPGGHLVLTSESDIVIHDGSGRWESILQDSNRKLVENRLTPENSKFAFVVSHPRYTEIWIHLPKEIGITIGADPTLLYPCDLALVYNYKTGSIVFRDTPDVFAATAGDMRMIGENTPQVWNGDAQAWEEDPTTWDEGSLSAKDGRSLVAVSSIYESFFLKMDEYSISIPQLEMYLERTGLAIDGKKTSGAFQVDTTMRKLVTDMWPVMEVIGQPHTIRLRLGGQEGISSPVRWEPEQIFKNELLEYTGPIPMDIENNPPFADGLRMSCLINTPMIAWTMRVGFKFGIYGRVRMQGFAIDLKAAGRTI